MILTLLIDLDGLFSLVDFLVASCSITEHIRVHRYCATTAILSPNQHTINITVFMLESPTSTIPCTLRLSLPFLSTF